MKYCLIACALFISSIANAQTDYCSEFSKVIKMMESGFSNAKATKGTESTTNYGIMMLTKRSWTSNYKFPESQTAEITETLRDAPDPKLAGHNVYISFSLVKNVTKDEAIAAFNKVKEKIRGCTPANWKLKENAGNTYSRYTIFDAAFYDDSPHKVTLQYNKMEGSDKYTADIIFDAAVK